MILYKENTKEETGQEQHNGQHTLDKGKLEPFLEGAYIWELRWGHNICLQRCYSSTQEWRER